MKTTHPFIYVSFVAFILLAESAWAHKVNVFAYVNDNTVFTESYYSDGKPVIRGTIEVTGDNDTLVVSGKTDEKGLYSFPQPSDNQLNITVLAGMGHKNHFLLVTKQKTGQKITEKTNNTTLSAPSESSASDTLALKEVQERSDELVHELQSIKREIALLRQEMSEPGLSQIIGGIGYIFGLFGLMAWAYSRRSSDKKE